MSSDDNRPGRATAPYFIKKFGELVLKRIEYPERVEKSELTIAVWTVHKKPNAAHHRRL